MFLKTIKLTNFRNFSKLDLDFAKTTLLIGENAQGKSNFLEAIYFLATTKSPRAEKDFQLIKEGEGGCFVEGEIDDFTKLEIGMQIGEEGFGLEKRVKVNGIPRRSVDYIGNLVAVHFAPEDINLVTGPPVLRRWHIDLVLAQIDKLYKNALTKYHEAIVSRNRILKRIKEGLSKTDELTFWSQQILDYGIVVSEKRRHFFQSLNDLKTEEQFKFDYLENVLTAERLQEYLGREIASCNTLIGPHRDDFVFVIYNNVIPAKAGIYTNNLSDGSPIRSGMTEERGRSLAHFGSRGEQRTAVLDLKLAELQFIKKFNNFLPILLLDDVFSELDTAHREYVISAISGQQTIISAVENEQIPASFLKKVQVINVKDGKFFV